MPNWCSSYVSIEGPENEINVLWEKFNEVEEKATIKTDFGKEWLGHILDYLGEYDREKGDATCSCRGHITDRDICSGQISLHVDSAWGPHLGPIAKLAKKFAPNAKILYEAIEPGCEVYLTNNPEVIGTYVFDLYDPDSVPESLQGDYDFLGEEELRDKMIEGVDGCAQDSTEDLIERVLEEYGNNLSINKMNYAGLWEVCI